MKNKARAGGDPRARIVTLADVEQRYMEAFYREQSIVPTDEWWER